MHVEAGLIRALARVELLQQQPERKQVARGRRRLAAGLFRAHVHRRTHHRAGGGVNNAGVRRQRVRGQHRRSLIIDRGGEISVRDPAAGVRRGAFKCAREPEVEHLHVTVRQQHDVLGFEIAVNHAGGVRHGQCAHHLFGDAHAGGPIETSPQRIAQAAPVNQLEDQIIGVVDRDVVVDAADVGMIELRQNPRLAQQPRARRLVEAMRATNGFERDLPLQRGVEGHVDLAHAAFAERADHLVVRNSSHSLRTGTLPTIASRAANGKAGPRDCRNSDIFCVT